MLDDTDRRILGELSADARLSMRKLAQRVGVALGTASTRVKRMEKLGVIRGYGVRLDPEKVGWSLTVIVGIRIAKGRLLEVQEKIAADRRVFGVYDVTGDVDSMILARLRNRRDLDHFTKNVLTMEGIERSFTHVVLNTVREDDVVLAD
jgi:DNA-binding Lrp family transcriptional regulator